MKRLTHIYIYLTILLGMALQACNSDKDIDQSKTITNTSVAINGFRFKANDKILANLDSVYFTINLDKALIYNADSLPKGTDVSRMLVYITTPSLSRCDIIVHRGGELGDTTYNFLKSQNDSIDFSYGPVTLSVTSKDGMLSKDYTVSVNVHKMDPDSLYWNKSRVRSLPSDFENPVAQKTVDLNDGAFCLTVDANGNACGAFASHPDAEWSTNDVSLPNNAVIRSLVSDNSSLYILDSEGNIFSSTDNAASWTPLNAKMTSLFGAFGEGRLLGALKADNGSWSLVEYPSGKSSVAPADFPVTENSRLIVYTTKWSDQPTAVMISGKTAEGRATSATWAYDGNSWARIDVTRNVIPALSDMTLVPYFAFRTSSSWRVTEQTVLIAMGGRNDLAGLSRVLYISFDRGVHWARANAAMQLPEYITTTASADALTFSTMISVDPDNGQVGEWIQMPDEKLPAWLFVETPLSRVEQAVTSWECPAIYLFGGESFDGQLSNTVWHGVINRLTFRPLY